MFKKILKIMSNYITILLSDKTITNFQRRLIDADLYIKTEEFISLTILIMILVLIILGIISFIFNISPTIVVILTISIPMIMITYVYYKNEKRLDKIELELPDYLRQLSALIKVGYGIESAFNELSKTIINGYSQKK